MLLAATPRPHKSFQVENGASNSRRGKTVYGMSKRSWLLALVVVPTVLLVVVGYVVQELDARAYQAQLLAADRDFQLVDAHAIKRIEEPLRLTRAVAEGVEGLVWAQESSDQLMTAQLKDGITRAFVSLLQSTTQIDHARLLNPDGLELLRVNRLSGGDVIRVADEHLQDKWGRDYVTGIRALQPGAVYMGAVSLNIEHGQIDPRNAPVARFGMPIHDVDNNLVALLVLNFDALLTPMPRVEDVATEPEIYYVNRMGEFVYGGTRFKENEYRWQKSTEAHSFAELYPDIWQAMQENPRGEIRLDDGLYLWKSSRDHTTVEPLVKAGLFDIPFGGSIQFLPNKFLHAGDVLATPTGLAAIALVFALYLFSVFAVVQANRAMNAERDARQGEHEGRLALEKEAKRRTRLLAMISHELRTPAASIAMLLDNAGRKLNDTEFEVFGLTKHLLQLMDDLKGIGLPGRDRAQDLIACKPSEIIDYAQQQSASVILASNIEIFVDVPAADDLTFKLDRYRIRTVISNLLRNACKHSQGTKVWVTVSVDEPTGIEERLKLRITVEDNGRGIPESKRAEVFDEFTKLERSSDGMGLGLAISRAWAQEMDGDLEYFKSPHGGAGFALSFQASLVPDTSAPNILDHQLGNLLYNKKILLVEDDMMIRRLTRKMLERVGCIVTAAADGQEALDCLGKGQFDLVVTDYFMPNLDGVQLIREMRKRHIYTPVFAATAATLGLELNELQEAGASHVFTKPLGVEDLEMAVQYFQAANG